MRRVYLTPDFLPPGHGLRRTRRASVLRTTASAASRDGAAGRRLQVNYLTDVPTVLAPREAGEICSSSGSPT